MSEAEESVDLIAEPIDLIGEQAPASIGARAKHGRLSHMQHVVWDAEQGDRKPSQCNSRQ